MMRLPHCGNVELENQHANKEMRRRNRRYALQGGQWDNSKPVTWDIRQYSTNPNVTKQLTDRDVTRAFDVSIIIIFM